jgi:FdhD protein
MSNTATAQFEVGKYKGEAHWDETDLLAVEEPLEIRLEYGSEGQRINRNLSITMRTPGADEDLAIGFLFTEGIVRELRDVAHVRTILLNSVLVSLRPELAFDMQKLERHFYTSSSCGVCGKSSIDAVRTVADPRFRASPKTFPLNPEVVYKLPDTLRQAQSTFDATGGLHASAIFDQNGRLLALREDVGRHNALDKLVGHCLQQGMLPLDEHILLLSGRASFELVQKAAMAGIRMVCAVGAPSSLAVETARSFDMTLIGFLREGRFNVYGKTAA